MANELKTIAVEPDITTMPLKEHALCLLTDQGQQAIDVLKSIMDQAARGVRISDEDRKRFEHLTARVNCGLNCLLGVLEDDARANDDARAQRVVDEFVANLLENRRDDITLEQADELEDGECVRKFYKWTDYESATRVYEVEFSIPRALVEDEVLRDQLLEEMNEEVRYNLEQFPEQECCDITDTEYDFGDP